MRQHLGGKTSEKKCRICQAKNIKIFLSGKDFHLLKCKKCGIIFTNPFPSKKELNEINKKKYGREDQRGYFNRLPQLTQTAHKIINEIKSFKKGGRFLDIGCGFGVLLNTAKEKGFRVLGIEKEQKTAVIARKKFNLKILSKNFDQVRLQPNSFDVVTLFDVLEHIKDPKKFLTDIKNLLKKEGLLVVQTPNIESMMFNLTKQKWNWLLLPNHLWHFSPKTLSMILKKEGFRILRLKTLDDLGELNFNLIDALGIKKISLFSKIIWKICRILFFGFTPFSYLWSKFNKGGLIRIMVKIRSDTPEV